MSRQRIRSHPRFGFIDTATNAEPDYHGPEDYNRLEAAGTLSASGGYAPRERPPALRLEAGGQPVFLPVNRFLGDIRIACTSQELGDMGELSVEATAERTPPRDYDDPKLRFSCELRYEYNPFGIGDYSLGASIHLEVDQFGHVDVLSQWMTSGGEYGTLSENSSIGGSALVIRN